MVSPSLCSAMASVPLMVCRILASIATSDPNLLPRSDHSSFRVVDMDRRMVAFKDESVGNITHWKWDFGDGTTSDEQSPIHTYEKPSVYYVVTLEVEGPSGTSRRSRYWEVMVK